MQKVLDTMLRAYYPECRYLQDAKLDFPTMQSNFKISKTFYGEQSGHFNATEMMICYNQIAYVFFAESFRKGLIKKTSAIPLEEFIDYQMNGWYIAKLNDIRFRSPIDPKNFSGDITIQKSIKRGNRMFFTTYFSFKDENNGYADGKALLALTLNPKK